MFLQAFARAAVRVGILGSVVLGIGIASVQPSLAGCEARCKAAKAGQICKASMDQKGLKGEERKAEFEKCRMDPYGYK